MTEEPLEGGRKGAILRKGDRVIRPVGPWSPAVHALLRHLRANGFYDAPEPLGFDEEGNEVVSFIKGDVVLASTAEFHADEKILAAAAKLLRRYHDAQAGFVPLLSAVWMHPPRYPAEVICHGDFAPYNVVCRNGLPVAIIDFDVAHPGPRVWDIAYALYRFVPCGHPELSGERSPLDIQAERIQLFLTAYGLGAEDRGGVIEQMILRLEAMTAHMAFEAENGDEKFRADIERGDLALYRGDIDWLKDNQEMLTKKVVA